MLKKLVLTVMLLAMSLSFALTLGNVKKEKISIGKKNDGPSYGMKLPYTGQMGDTFDQGMNGLGWCLLSTRKIQTFVDPLNGPMVGAVYRRLENSSGSGTIGGMVGTFGDTFAGYAQVIYGESPYQAMLSGGIPGQPGGRYPYANEFINGYFFGTFNDYDLVDYIVETGDISQPMFTVCDATLGYDLSFWSEPARVVATEGGAVVPAAWTGNGDVVYDSESGYYYWTQTWNEDLDNLDEAVLDVVVGRSTTPADPASWVWSDYNDLRYDGKDDESGVISIGDAYVCYCKDTEGNGTGYGMVIANTNDVDDYVQNQAGEEVLQNGKISYLYTTNWGGDDNSGDWSPNWIADGDKFFQVESKDILEWYGETIATYDSVGVDSLGNTIWEVSDVITMDDPSIQWAISGVATENNNVHILFKVWPGTIESPDSYYLYTDMGMRGGLYHVKAHITETGVEWSKAVQVASFVHYYEWLIGEVEEIEYYYYNSINMSIGYAGTINGKEAVYASWMDKPIVRPTVSPFVDDGGNTKFIDDIYFSTSTDGGNNWDYGEITEYLWDVVAGDTIYANVYYGTNVTMTGNTHEDAFSISNHGFIDYTVKENPTIMAYGACQYYDPSNLTVPDLPADFTCYSQFYKAWKITGEMTGIVESEEVNLVKDFALYQNYPNPFNPLTDIQFNLQNNSEVKLSVFNTKGEMVAELANGKLAKGLHTVSFDASTYNSGVYFYKLEVNGMSETKKMVLTK